VWELLRRRSWYVSELSLKSRNANYTHRVELAWLL
jgi:hypothetical protein